METFDIGGRQSVRVTKYIHRRVNVGFPLMAPLFMAPTNSSWPYQGCWPSGPRW